MAAGAGFRVKVEVDSMARRRRAQGSGAREQAHRETSVGARGKRPGTMAARSPESWLLLASLQAAAGVGAAPGETRYGREDTGQMLQQASQPAIVATRSQAVSSGAATTLASRLGAGSRHGVAFAHLQRSRQASEDAGSQESRGTHRVRRTAIFCTVDARSAMLVSRLPDADLCGWPT